MSEQSPSHSQGIDLNIAEELAAKDFRDEFFRAELEIEIPRQIKELRKLRGLRQKEIAEKSGMKQSAISRLEGADYGKWRIDTLLRLAEALDAKLTVIFEPYEAVVARYKSDQTRVPSALSVRIESEAQKVSTIPFNSISQIGEQPTRSVLTRQNEKR